MSCSRITSKGNTLSYSIERKLSSSYIVALNKSAVTFYTSNEGQREPTWAGQCIQKILLYYRKEKKQIPITLLENKGPFRASYWSILVQSSLLGCVNSGKMVVKANGPFTEKCTINANYHFLTLTNLINTMGQSASIPCTLHTHTHTYIVPLTRSIASPFRRRPFWAARPFGTTYT